MSDFEQAFPRPIHQISPENSRHNRRNFLKLGGAALAAGAFVLTPLPVHGQNETLEVVSDPTKPKQIDLENSYKSSIVFTVDNKVSSGDQEYVKKGINLAERYFQGMGVTLSRPYEIIVKSNQFPGISGTGVIDGKIYWYMSPNWRAEVPEQYVQGALIHEYAHVIQQDLAGVKDSTRTPLWFNEGSAVVLEEDALVKANVLALDEVRNMRLFYFQNNDHLVKPLSVYEDNKAMNVISWDVYNLGTLAVRNLTAEFGLESILDFYKNVKKVGDWKRAFQETFKVPVDQFYIKIEALRKDKNLSY